LKEKVGLFPGDFTGNYCLSGMSCLKRTFDGRFVGLQVDELLAQLFAALGRQNVRVNGGIFLTATAIEAVPGLVRLCDLTGYNLR
jgi:hypothetical protein